MSRTGLTCPTLVSNGIDDRLPGSRKPPTHSSSRRVVLLVAVASNVQNRTDDGVDKAMLHPLRRVPGVEMKVVGDVKWAWSMGRKEPLA